MRADRLLSLMLTLRARGRMTAKALAAELEVSERTVYRDVEALMIAGVPIYTRSGNEGGIFLDEAYRVTLTGLSPQEIQALFMMSGSGHYLRDLGLDRAAEDSALKLFAALPQIHRHEVERLRERLYLDPDGWFSRSESAPDLPLIQQAIWENRYLEFTYQRRDGAESRRRVRPYGLVASSGAWYVVAAKDDRFESLRVFRVSRLSDITLMAEVFERPADFDLVAHWNASREGFRHIIMDGVESFMAMLRVHPDYLWYFAGQYEERLPDVDGWVVLRLEFVSMAAARLEILALGENAVVIEPAFLRDEILRTIQTMRGNYLQDDESSI